jgi:FRG domain
MNDLRINSWSELNEALFADTWNPTLRRFRSTFAYRGAAVESYSLTNSLSRLGAPYATMERNLIKQFKKYAHPHIVERDTEWHWLSIGQHHGLPTRLMDWTYSPLVALHFATNELEKYNYDGAVWKVNYSEVHDLLQNAQTASLASLGARIFSVDALAETIPDLEALDKLRAPNFDIAVFFEPPAIDSRIANQFAYFSVLSDPFLSMDEWLARPQIAGKVSATKIIIPKALKWEVRDKLDQSNVTERVLMPGLDGLCAWLRRHYKPV